VPSHPAPTQTTRSGVVPDYPVLRHGRPIKATDVVSPIVPRWEWRTFAHAWPHADAVFDAATPVSVEESEEVYLLAPGGDNVKVRDGLLDIKVLRETDAAGLQRWQPILKAPAPLDADATRAVFQALRRPVPAAPPDGLTLDAVMAEAGVGAAGGPRKVRVHKRRTRYRIADCQAERSTHEAEGRRTVSIAVESADPQAVLAAVKVLGLSDYVNLDVPTGLRMLIDQVPERYAVIDVGTNSIKFHVAELDVNGRGPWQKIVDRAVVTRLGEGLDTTGEIGAEPLGRTARAMMDMADEARSQQVRAAAAVGTAGFRLARNGGRVLEALRAQSGLPLEVISGEDEGRLAYLAVATGVGLGDKAIVAFDTGGGSSQFTFGHGPDVHERFSVGVGAVRFTERYGLAEKVSAEVVADASAAIAAELTRLDGRPRPDAVVAMGGAVTNLAAVKHGLATYDPDVVQGTVLDRVEIDRQIESYRSLDAAGRRLIVGLQPARAEVILAGACIVRTILDKLDSQTVTVSDHGLRHGVLIERFGWRPG
jgi:exopolyphosphatase / guanosine-5'-triphosphate,3'-diphosphate pyrophosphatase